jgi:hypothetical protein
VTKAIEFQGGPYEASLKINAKNRCEAAAAECLRYIVENFPLEPQN